MKGTGRHSPTNRLNERLELAGYAKARALRHGRVVKALDTKIHFLAFS
jgi:hypothetical protein